jgi:hypothetical protein
MNPIEPSIVGLHQAWRRAVSNGSRQYHVPALEQMVRIAPSSSVTGEKLPLRVITMWEPDDRELATLFAQIETYRAGGPKPRFSVMTYVAGEPLQPLSVVIGDIEGLYPAQNTSARTDGE